MFQLWKIVFLMFISLLLNACISSLPLKKVTDSTTPIERPFYTILPPSGDEWLYMTKDEGGGRWDVFFGKNFPSPTHTLIATVTKIHSYAQFKSKDDFLAFVKQSSMMDIDPRRFNLTDSKFVTDNRLGKYAVTRYSAAEDRKAVNAQENDYLLLKIYGLFFVHPDNDSIVISIDYSERGKNNEIDSDFEAKAIKFIEGFKLK